MEEMIITEEQRKLIKEYSEEALNHLRSKETATSMFNEVVEAAAGADGTNIDKKVIQVIRSFYTKLYADKLNDSIQQADLLKFLSE